MGDAGYRIKEESLIRTDITAYLERHETKDLLRLLTCGSVDDGKSTLIGRLLYDSHMIYEDQLDKVAKDSKIFGTTDDGFDPALLTDGLKAEREQGITIDVAYRYFSTDKRKFIIADCPGHEQYTRNMATGASNCNLAVILIDARYGVIPQTRRHSFICSLLGIKHVVVAVNKMDLVGWSEKTYNRIMQEFNSFVARLNFSDIHFIPMSALHGDNVVEHSDHLDWYDGPTFLHHLETLNISTDRNLIDMRFPVQYVIRPDQNFRGFSGTLASGVMRPGDKVTSLPSRQDSRIREIHSPDGPVEEAFAPMAVTVTLEDEIDLSRGDMLVPMRNQPHIGNEFEAMVVWMHQDAAEAGRSYVFKHTSNMVPGVLSDIRYRIDVNTMQRERGEKGEARALAALEMNEIGRCHVTLHRPIAFDAYDRNHATGAFVIVDRVSNVTVGAGMIVDRIVPRKERDLEPVSRNILKSTSLVSPQQRRELLGQKGVTVWLTGLSASGKSTIARELEKRLVEEGHLAYILDGDNVRHGLNRDLGFSMDDRKENIRRIAEVAALMNEAGVVVVTAFISPYRQDRKAAREVIGEEAFIEAFVDTPLEVCEARDPKGLYKKARAGEIRQFTGISDAYEPPRHADITLETEELQPGEAVDVVIRELRERGVLGPAASGTGG
jgi:bifunctional enzyme CysN/CysC